MNSESLEHSAAPATSGAPQTSDDGQRTASATPDQATVIVRGETVREQRRDRPSKDSTAKDTSTKELSEAKVKMQALLPALADDPDVGVQKQHVVVRDGKADLSFAGVLLASAASPTATEGRWEEYRVYETNGGKHVFSKAKRSIFAKDQDHYEAEVFDPSPSSMPSQLLRGARELTRSRPLVWTDAAATFFGYSPLAKALYRKLGDQFEEHVS
jgi:hypothetical protein